MTNLAALEPIDAVRPVGDGEEAFVGLAVFAQRGAEVGHAGALAHCIGGRDHMRATRHQRVIRRFRFIEVEHARNAARFRREADRHGDVGIAVVEQYRVEPGHRCLGIFRDRFVQSLVAAGRDHLFAGGVDQYQRYRRTRARHPQGAADVDVLAGERLDDGAGDLVVMIAERADIAGLAAEPGHGDRGIAGLAAAGDEEFGRLHLGAGIGEFVHPHHNVLHGAAGAQDFAGFVFARRQSKPISFSTQARMM